MISVLIVARLLWTFVLVVLATQAIRPLFSWYAQEYNGTGAMACVLLWLLGASAAAWLITGGVVGFL